MQLSNSRIYNNIYDSIISIINNRIVMSQDKILEHTSDDSIDYLENLIKSLALDNKE